MKNIDKSRVVDMRDVHVVTSFGQKLILKNVNFLSWNV